MNNYDYNLYNLLKKCKEKLQVTNYDKLNERKPNICSDESLQLLARYQPKTLEDMTSISGIGDGFINKYGNDFLQVIKEYSNNLEVPISDKEMIILSKLENRLVSINQRNKLLYSGKINKNTGIDIFNLVFDIDSFEKFILNQETKSFKLLNINSFDDKNLKNLLKLIREANKNEVETGENNLYIAYPFIQGKAENEDFNFKAPLMLFPVKIERTEVSINLLNDTSRDIIYNTHLILANNKFNGKNIILPDNKVENFDPSNFMQNIIDFYKSNELYITYNNSKLEKFFENKANEFPDYKNGQLEIKRYMILGLYSTYVTSMYADFHKMIEQKDITKLVKELLWGLEEQDETTYNYDESSNDINTDKNLENQIYYINELDYSQEKVLKLIANNQSIVVQGPPGTGKSQTITSIIAQSILNGKKVLMVSEKKTALDVIYSRLGNLSKYALLLDDAENKDEFYNQLINILSNLKNSYNEINYDYSVNHVSSITRENSIINNNLDELNYIATKMYEINDFGTSMYTVYNNCKKIDLNDDDQLQKNEIIKNNITQNILSLKYFEVKNIFNNLNNNNFTNPIKSYIRIVKNNKEINNIKNNLISIDIINLKNKIKELDLIIQKYNTESFYKKPIIKIKINKLITSIYEEYFTSFNNYKKYILNNYNDIDNTLDNYSDFMADKFVYDKLSEEEKEYINLISILQNKFHIPFEKCNEEIYNYILNYVINNFEKDNANIFTYINNFDNIIRTINKSIANKKQFTYEETNMELLKCLGNLSLNNRLSKIEEICNRKRKPAIKKFMDKYKIEMLDSIKIWLMTPEVVSDILPFEKDYFDLVVFDEASQLYVEKAIPAIYRAKQIVIAGDKKQLRPSSLGKGRINDNFDEDEIEDGILESESLLDAAGYKFPSTMLNYHYRSKYEELIAFSNYAFYNGKLMITSDAKVNYNTPITRIKVENGLWLDKKNIAEANEVVNLVKEILYNRKNNETFGVITFNSSQRDLIEDLIEHEKMIDSKFAAFISIEENRFDNGENVSFFVKNIENVQGDERDIIIFCIGYAKNASGRVSINFGWLNQEGGENRLNVAISRAKSKIFVITSIEPEELEVYDTKNKGPKLFKEYLRYAKAISENNKELVRTILLSLLDVKINENNQLTFDSDFEEEVCNKLSERGYNVATQYGVGCYRIDLVVKSKETDQILLGIECDGRLYHSSKSARERDYHRQKYLESRNWKIYRIWSSNWWHNPDLEIQKLEAYIKSLNNDDSSLINNIADTQEDTIKT